MALVVFWDSLSGVNPWFFGGIVCQSVPKSHQGGLITSKISIELFLPDSWYSFLRGLRGWQNMLNNWYLELGASSSLTQDSSNHEYCPRHHTPVFHLVRGARRERHHVDRRNPQRRACASNSYEICRIDPPLCCFAYHEEPAIVASRGATSISCEFDRT
jgi:hypothetical protein